MGLDAPGITPTKKLKRAKRPRSVVAEVDAQIKSHQASLKGTTTDDERARSSAGTRRYAAANKIKPRTAKQLAADPLVRVRPPAKPKGLTSNGLSGTPIRSQQSRSMEGDVAGIARAIGHTVRAIGSTVAEDPRQSARKTASSAGQLAKGIVVPLAAPFYTAAYPINRAIGNDVESPVKIGKRLVKAEADRVSRTYGPSFRGDKGAYGKLRAVVKEEGPLLPALDVSVVAGPTSSLIGGAARAGKLGARAARVTSTRPAVRVGMTPSATKAGRVRKSAIGAGVGAAHDAARRAGQRVAVARSTERLRVRAAKRVLRRSPSTNSLLHADPKPLSPRRNALAPNEVTPLINARANRRVRYSVARRVTMGETAARIRVKRHVAGKDGVQAVMRTVPRELHDVVAIAKQLGIRDAKGARVIIAKRLAEIEKRTAEARAKSGPHAHHDAAMAATIKGEAPEAVRLRELLAKPEVFARPDVLSAVEKTIAIERAAVGAREGLGAERAAAGRAGLVGETLGVKTATQLNREARAVKDAGRAEARTAYDEAVAARATVRAGAEKRLTGARRALAKAEGRAEVLSRNVTGSNTLKGRGTAKYAGGAVGVRQAQRALDEAKLLVDRDLGAATAAVKAAAEARKAAIRAPLKPLRESHTQYEARVAAAAKEHGLAPPEHTTSKFTEDTEGIASTNPRSGTSPANPLGQRRQGTNYRLGTQAHETETSVRGTRAAIERGARIEAEQEVLREHAMYFAGGQAEAEAWAAARGLDMGDLVTFPATGGVVRKDMASSAELSKSKDHGAYVAAKGLFLAEKSVKQELDALNLKPTAPGRILHTLALGPQAALLALSPSWWAFQRVNDAIGMVAGGSALQARSHGQMLKALDEDAREITQLMSGGSVSSDFLTPRTGQKLGRMQRVLDENPTYRDALRSDAPATNLLFKFAHDAPTLLLRSDAKITGNVRERQFLHNLQRLARTLDPEVAKIHKGFGPFGHALKTGDVALMQKLLKDPKYAALRDEAAESLNRVMGDWHNYTAKERRVKGAFAFYGFLRYSTRMALYTLPVDHPYIGLLAAQLGAMGDEDVRNIIGDDMPYGLGKLYQSNGEVAFDLVRANPVTGPLVSISKPEHLFQLATPLASIMASTVLGQPIGLSDSATGFVKQFTTNGSLKPDGVGGFTSDERLRILGDQILSLLSPYKVWKNWDSRAQSSDSLAFDRRIITPTTGAEKVKIDEKNATGPAGGAKGAAHGLVPLLAPGDGRNWAKIGERATAARKQREDDVALDRAKAKGARTPLGRAKIELDAIDAQIDAAGALADDEIAAIDRAIELKLIEQGLDP